MDATENQGVRQGSPEAMYDAFSAEYDHFVDWDARLAAEMPFLEQQLQSAGADRVLDVACGTGMHAVALARRGYEVVGVDSSAPMIQRARANAAEAGVEVDFQVASFGNVVDTLTMLHVEPTCDAVLCLGNSLPHVLTTRKLGEALDDLTACLRTEGLVLVQNRNFDRVLSARDRWMNPQGHRHGAHEWLFVRFYDFEADGLLTFNMLTFHREGDEPWEQRLTSTKLWPLTHRDLVPMLERAGLGQIAVYGDMEGAAFDPDGSPNLVVAALKTS